MEDQVWAVVLAKRLQAPGVADIGDDGMAAQRGGGVSQFRVDLPQRVFAMVEQDQFCRAEGGELAGEFGADAATGPGQQDAAPGDELGMIGEGVGEHIGRIEQHRAVPAKEARYPAPGCGAPPTVNRRADGDLALVRR